MRPKVCGRRSSTSSRPATRLPTAQLRSEEPARHRRKQSRPYMTLIRVGRVEEPRSDWRRAVAAVSERRVAEGRALYTQRSPAELYRGARSSEREHYARPRGPRKFAPANFWGEPASRLGAQRPSTRPARVGHHKGLDASGQFLGPSRSADSVSAPSRAAPGGEMAPRPTLSATPT